jgi:hypothetical protein
MLIDPDRGASLVARSFQKHADKDPPTVEAACEELVFDTYVSYPSHRDDVTCCPTVSCSVDYCRLDYKSVSELLAQCQKYSKMPHPCGHTSDSYASSSSATIVQASVQWLKAGPFFVKVADRSWKRAVSMIGALVWHPLSNSLSPTSSNPVFTICLSIRLRRCLGRRYHLFRSLN